MGRKKGESEGGREKKKLSHVFRSLHLSFFKFIIFLNVCLFWRERKSISGEGQRGRHRI